MVRRHKAEQIGCAPSVAGHGEQCAGTFGGLIGNYFNSLVDGQYIFLAFFTDVLDPDLVRPIFCDKVSQLLAQKNSLKDNDSITRYVPPHICLGWYDTSPDAFAGWAAVKVDNNSGRLVATAYMNDGTIGSYDDWIVLPWYTGQPVVKFAGTYDHGTQLTFGILRHPPPDTAAE